MAFSSIPQTNSSIPINYAVNICQKNKVKQQMLVTILSSITTKIWHWKLLYRPTYFEISKKNPKKKVPFAFYRTKFSSSILCWQQLNLKLQKLTIILKTHQKEIILKQTHHHHQQLKMEKLKRKKKQNKNQKLESKQVFASHTQFKERKPQELTED